MDWINKNNMIIEKMKTQMLSRGVDSLDKIYAAIGRFSDNQEFVPRIHFEKFLASIGIYLKTQEINELHKFLQTFENEVVKYEDFIRLILVEMPESMRNSLISIWEFLSAGNERLAIDDLISRLNIQREPRVKLMIKTREEIEKDWCFSIEFAARSNSIGVDEFLAINGNRYVVTPKENMTNFLQNTFEVWGAPKKQ